MTNLKLERCCSKTVAKAEGTRERFFFRVRAIGKRQNLGVAFKSADFPDSSLSAHVVHFPPHLDFQRNRFVEIKGDVTWIITEQRN